MSRSFVGVFAATLTPCDAAGAVDAGVVRTLTRYLINEGLEGTCPSGTTGEFPALSTAEKDLVNRSACEAAGEEGRVIAGVWGATAAERAELARHAEAHEAAAVFCTIPVGETSSRDDLLEWYRDVKRATRLPVFAYNIPQVAGQELPLPVLDELAREGAILGYKDSSPDPERVRAAVKLLRGRIPVFAGNEAVFAVARDAGVDGFISGIAGVFPRTVLAVWRGDRKAAERLRGIKEAVSRCGGVAALKYLAGRRGFSVGGPRPPVAPVSDDGRRELDRLDRDLGRDL